MTATVTIEDIVVVSLKLGCATVFSECDSLQLQVHHDPTRDRLRGRGPRHDTQPGITAHVHTLAFDLNGMAKLYR